MILAQRISHGGKGARDYEDKRVRGHGSAREERREKRELSVIKWLKI